MNITHGSLLVALAIFTANPSSAEIWTAAKVLDQYKAYCADEFSEELMIDGDAVYSLQVGSAPTETTLVIDTSGLKCGEKPLGFCGSSGCDINLIIGEQLYVKRGWSPLNIQFNNQHLILMPLSGGMCGNLPNSSPCFTVLAWDEQERKLNYPN
jgi:hypothetical protein